MVVDEQDDDCDNEFDNIHPLIIKRQPQTRLLSRPISAKTT